MSIKFTTSFTIIKLFSIILFFHTKKEVLCLNSFFARVVQSLAKMKFADIFKEKTRLLKTLAMYFAFIGHGFGLGVQGPSMLDLQIKTSSTLEQITYIIIGRASGLGFGSILSPLFLKYFDIQFLLTASLAVAGILEAVVPLNYNVWGVVGTFFANGFCFGIIETCCNVFMVNLWGKKCPPFLQALHFCFGLGGFSAPLLVRPFLLPNQDAVANEDNDLLAWTPSDVHVQYAYYGIALVMGLASCFFFYVYVFHRETPAMKDDSTVDVSQDDSLAKESLKIKLFRGTIYCNAALFMCFYCGIEIALGSYLTAFGVRCGLHLEKKTAALMSSVYWICFTFSRLATIFYIDYIGPKNNLIMALGLVVFSNVFLVPFGDKLEWCLWLGISLNGIGMSSIWAAMFAFIDGYIPLTNSLTSFMVCAACVGECVIPIAVSAVIETDVTVFLWVILGCSLTQALLFALIMTLLPRFAKMSNSHVTLS